MSNNPYNAQKDATQSSSAQKNATGPRQDGDTKGTRILKERGEAKIDIVFVHGLIGKEAWTSDTGVFWPDSLLASNAPEVRVLSFTYSENISPLFKEGTRIEVISGRLLSDLIRHRKETPTRPVIFVAHCLGGVILENAIVRASNSSNPEEKGLVPCIRGLLLLGTPHFKKGSEQDAKAYFKYALEARSPESPIFDEQSFDEQLQPLRAIYEEFIDFKGPGEARFKIASFCAGRGNAVSDTLAHWWENSRSQMLDRNQLQLSQYETENDPDFIQVMETLTSWSKIEQPKARTVGPEYVAHVTFEGSKNAGMQVGQNTSSISGLTFTTHTFS